jgi:pSer/pThr/pTyr-binding forkhead associated (FHA) protein
MIFDCGILQNDVDVLPRRAMSALRNRQARALRRCADTILRPPTLLLS